MTNRQLITARFQEIQGSGQRPEPTGECSQETKGSGQRPEPTGGPEPTGEIQGSSQRH